MNSYKTSDGNRVNQSEIDRKTTAAKKELIENQLIDEGYIYCKTCGRNDCVPVDCAHKISVGEAKKTGRAELCWSLENMELTGRFCHKKQDGLDLQFNTENER